MSTLSFSPAEKLHKQYLIDVPVNVMQEHITSTREADQRYNHIVSQFNAIWNDMPLNVRPQVDKVLNLIDGMGHSHAFTAEYINAVCDTAQMMLDIVQADLSRHRCGD